MIKIEYFLPKKNSKNKNLGINFQVGSGEIKIIYHDNLSKMKDFFQAMCMMVPPQQGVIYVDGIELNNQQNSHSACDIFNHHIHVIETIDPWELNLSVDNALKKYAHQLKINQDILIWKIKHALASTNILTEKTKPISQLSPNNKISYLFARAILHNCDNVYVNLDVFDLKNKEICQHIHNCVVKLSSFQKAIILFSNNEEALFYFHQWEQINLSNKKKEYILLDKLYIPISKIEKNDYKNNFLVKTISAYKLIFHQFWIIYLLLLFALSACLIFASYSIYKYLPRAFGDSGSSDNKNISANLLTDSHNLFKLIFSNVLYFILTCIFVFVVYLHAQKISKYRHNYYYAQLTFKKIIILFAFFLVFFVCCQGILSFLVLAIIYASTTGWQSIPIFFVCSLLIFIHFILLEFFAILIYVAVLNKNIRSIFKIKQPNE